MLVNLCMFYISLRHFVFYFSESCKKIYSFYKHFLKFNAILYADDTTLVGPLCSFKYNRNINYSNNISNHNDYY